MKQDGRFRQRLGARIRELRRRHGLSQAELGARAGLSGKFVGQMERGAANPSLNALLTVAEALGIQPQHLFDNAPAMPVDSDRAMLRGPDADRARQALTTLVQLLRVGPTTRRERH